MTTISARIDEALKDDAEKIAENIGLSLSAVLNVFLRRFVMEQGFPFELKMINQAHDIRTMSTQDIMERVQESVRQSSTVPELPPVTFLEPDTNILTTQA